LIQIFNVVYVELISDGINSHIKFVAVTNTK